MIMWCQPIGLVSQLLELSRELSHASGESRVAEYWAIVNDEVQSSTCCLQNHAYRYVIC